MPYITYITCHGNFQDYENLTKYKPHLLATSKRCVIPLFVPLPITQISKSKVQFTPCFKKQ